ncbi:MAG: AmmeMemoRadiSam system radical SAM enzyme [Chloroflexi bacterium]|nr:AmmeMemoRadiSam system radical SAM enzyme [Chloroflexota bacterium]
MNSGNGDTGIPLRHPIAGDVPLTGVIDPLVREGELYERLPDGAVHCYACSHRCKIRPGARGICQVRYNLDSRLYVPWGYVSALNCDPIEKKPFFHVHPGGDVLTFGMLGCDLHCPFCQNWDISQTLRDANAGEPPAKITPAQIVQLARRHGARGVASSYNEPLITSEWAVDIFKQAKAAGLLCMYVSNGNATREVLEYLRPYTDAYKIDLKTMRDANYRALGAVLDRVLDGARMVHAMGFWLEIVTLLIPGFNDSDDELRDAAQFIKSLSPDIPWHVTAFHQDYRMRDPANTPAQGVLPGRTASYEHTYCPNCHAALIERTGFRIQAYRLTPDGACPQCHTPIAGIWQ